MCQENKVIFAKFIIYYIFNYRILDSFKYNLKAIIFYIYGENMNKFNKICEKRGMVWLNFNRSCPKCKSYIPKYKRVCPECGAYIKNVQGKVFSAK